MFSYGTQTRRGAGRRLLGATPEQAENEVLALVLGCGLSAVATPPHGSTGTALVVDQLGHVLRQAAKGGLGELTVGQRVGRLGAELIDEKRVRPLRAPVVQLLGDGLDGRALFALGVLAVAVLDLAFQLLDALRSFFGELLPLAPLRLAGLLRLGGLALRGAAFLLALGGL